MSNSNNGGSAFPLPLGNANMSEPSESGGMSLRDYFAAKALQGYLASFDPHGEPVEYATKIAEDAYAMANAMLTARESDSGQVEPDTKSHEPSLLPEKNCEPTCAMADREYENELDRKNDSGPYTCKKCGYYMPF